MRQLYNFFCALLALVFSCHPALLQGKDTPSSASSFSSAFAFERNEGQIIDNTGQRRPDILYMARSAGVDVYLSRTGLHYVFSHMDIPTGTSIADQLRRASDTTTHYVRRQHRVDMKLVGGNMAGAVEASHEYHDMSIYYLSHCPHGVEASRYGRIVYRNVYPHIDLVLTTQAAGMKYDFVVHPGGDPSVVALEYSGAESIRLNTDGSLEVGTPLGTVREEAPYIYQGTNTHGHIAQQSAVAGKFLLKGNTVRFSIGEYDRSHTLVIDPGVLWSTYYGGADMDVINDVTTDRENNVIVTGFTTSQPFAASPGAFQDTIPGNRITHSDAFLSKFNRHGQRLWSTYLGGSNEDVGTTVAADSIGNIIIAGGTLSEDLPDSLGAVDTLNNKSKDGFVFKFTRSGKRTWGSYCGGGLLDLITDVAINRLGDIFVIGLTQSDRYSFPVRNAIQEVPGGITDGFIARFAPANGGILWCSFYGGSDTDYMESLVIDSNNTMYIAGTTRSANLPGTSNGYQNTLAGSSDAFFVRMRPDGVLLGASYYGGSLAEEGRGITLDPVTHDFIFCGVTASSDFPVAQAFQDTLSGISTDMAIVRMSGDGRQRRWATYYGDTAADEATAIAAFKDGSTAIVGVVRFAATPAIARPVLMIWTPAGNTPSLTYYGITDITGAAVDTMNNLVTAGYTHIGGLVVKNAYQSARAGQADGFIIRYGCDVEVTVTPSREPTFCSGATVTLDAGAGFRNYLWNTGATTQTISVSTSGQFRVTVTDDLACSKLSTTILVTVNPLPQPVIVSTTPVAFCEGGSVELQLSQQYTQYQWSDNTTSSTLVADKSGVYSVTVTDQHGCTAIASTTVTVTVQPKAAVRSAIDFGELAACRSSVVDTIGVVNTGSEVFEIISVELIGATGDFSVLPQITTPLKVNPSARQQFSVRFQPTGLGSTQAFMKFTLSPCGREYIVELNGSKADLASVTFSASTVDMGKVLLCEEKSADTSITLYNRGTAAITVGEEILAPPFSIVGSVLPATIIPNDSLTIPLRFTPASEGKSTGELRLPYAAGTCRDTLTFSLMAEAIDAVLSSDVQSITFSSLTGCESSTTAVVRVRLSGLTSASITGVEGSEHFVMGEPVPIELTAGERNVVLKFQPTSEGIFNASLRLTYSVGSCEKEIAIDATGSKQGVSFSAPETVDFGELIDCLAESGTATITLGASGGEGEVSSVVITGDNFTTTLKEGENIPSGGQKQYQVQFVPTGEGDAEGTLQIVFEPCTITRTIALRGRRTKAAVSVAQADVSYGIIPSGQKSTQSATLRNTGTTPVEITGIEGISAPFAITGQQQLPAMVQPGEELTVQVEFTSQAGEHRDTLRFVTGRPCDLPADVRLFAIGRDADTRGRATLLVPTDLRANVHTRNFALLVILQSQSDLQESGATSLRLRLQFNGTLFSAVDAEPGVITNQRVDNTGLRTVEIEIDNITNYTPGTVLTQLTGDVLLGNSQSTPIQITDVQWESTAVVQTETSDGLLTIDGVCEADGTRLLDYGSFGISAINPNPATDPAIEIEVQTIEEAETSLEIYNSTGVQVFGQRWFATAASRRINVDARLAAGIYSVVLRSPARTDTRMLVVAP